MNFLKLYRFFVIATLLGLLVVVIAGSLVKATDSGMGCPDWPKCYGHFIPPSNPDDVHWNTNHSYFDGQMVIENEKLWKAKRSFTSSSQFNEENWVHYNEHSYTIYNPTHTLIEYINRLATVVLGLLALGMLVLSFSNKKDKKTHVGLSMITIILIGFEAWLGKMVVSSELSPIKISIHLYAAFILVMVMTITYTKTQIKIPVKVDKPKTKLIAASLLVLCIQLFFGTKLREIFDRFYSELDIARDFWIQDAGIPFLVHRSFSLVYLLMLYFIYDGIKHVWSENKRIKNAYVGIISICLLEIFSGIIMAYFEVPRAVQPLHVFLSASLLTSHFYLFVEYKKSLTI